MIRIGFFLGFLLGGGIASLLAQSNDQDAGPSTDGHSMNPVVSGIKSQLGEAREVAHEAQLEKEAEMLSLRDDLILRRVPPKE